jgi:hypothetical protein
MYLHCARSSQADIGVADERCAWILLEGPEVAEFLAALSRDGATAEQVVTVHVTRCAAAGYGGGGDAGKPEMPGRGGLSSGSHGVAGTGEIWGRCRVSSGWACPRNLPTQRCFGCLGVEKVYFKSYKLKVVELWRNKS